VQHCGVNLFLPIARGNGSGSLPQEGPNPEAAPNFGPSLVRKGYGNWGGQPMFIVASPHAGGSQTPVDSSDLSVKVPNDLP